MKSHDGSRRSVVRSLRPLASLTVAALLAACTVGPDFTAPKPPETKSYTQPGEAALPKPGEVESPQRVELGRKISVDWWTLFHSPELDQVVKLALANNRSLAATKETLAQAWEAVAVASGGLYPQLGASTSFTRQQINVQTFGFTGFPGIPPFNVFSIGPSVSYALDVFGGTRRSIEQQAALAETQVYQLDAAYLSLTGDVATEALLVAAVRAQIKAIDDILADDQENLKLVKTAHEAGSVTQVDVLSAESQLDNDRTLLPPLRQQLSAARHALSVLIGKAPGDWSPPVFELSKFKLPSELPVMLPSELVHDRPDIRAAEAQLHAASAAIGVATANQYPSVVLSASLAQEGINLGHLFTPTSTVWDFAAGLTAPILRGGELEARKRAAIDAYKAAAETYQQTVLTSFQQVADVLEAMAHDGELIAAQRQALDSAEASLKLTRISYSAGNVGVLQVLDAQRLVEQARLGHVRAEAQRLQDTVQLFLALGGNALSHPVPPHTTAPFPSALFQQ